MRLVIMQPSFMPWLGYFDLFLHADLFLVYDNVQYDKDGWRNRNRIKTPNGPQWITVPVLTKGQNKPTNRDIRVNNLENWQRKHLGSLQMNYAKAPYFKEVFPMIESIYTHSWDLLIDLNMACIEKLCQYLGIQTPMRFVSEVKIDLPEGKNEKLIRLCREVGATEFYEPKGGEGYIDPVQFEQAGIRLTFQDYAHPVYPQLHGEFVSQLSTLDLLFNCGPASAEILRASSNLAGS